MATFRHIKVYRSQQEQDFSLYLEALRALCLSAFIVGIFSGVMTHLYLG